MPPLETDAAEQYRTLVERRAAYKEAGVETLPMAPWILFVGIEPKSFPRRLLSNRAQFFNALVGAAREIDPSITIIPDPDKVFIVFRGFHAGVVEIEMVLLQTTARILATRHGLQDFVGFDRDHALTKRFPEASPDDLPGLIPDIEVPEQWTRCIISGIPYSSVELKKIRGLRHEIGFNVHNSGSALIVERDSASTVPPLQTNVRLYELLASHIFHVLGKAPVSITFDPLESDEERTCREALAMPLTPALEEISLSRLGNFFVRATPDLIDRAYRQLRAAGIEMTLDQAQQLAHRSTCEEPEIARRVLRRTPARGAASLEGMDERMIAGLLIEVSDFNLAMAQIGYQLGEPAFGWLQSTVAVDLGRTVGLPDFSELQGPELLELREHFLTKSTGRVVGSFRTRIRGNISIPENFWPLIEQIVRELFQNLYNPLSLGNHLREMVATYAQLHTTQYPGEANDFESALARAQNVVILPFQRLYGTLLRDPLYRSGFTNMLGDQSHASPLEAIRAMVEHSLHQHFATSEGMGQA